jgi:hypothetical protein
MEWSSLPFVWHNIFQPPENIEHIINVPHASDILILGIVGTAEASASVNYKGGSRRSSGPLITLSDGQVIFHKSLFILQGSSSFFREEVPPINACRGTFAQPHLMHTLKRLPVSSFSRFSSFTPILFIHADTQFHMISAALKQLYHYSANNEND